MSKEKRIIEIAPPRGHMTSEHLISKGHSCGYCYGNGFFWGEDDYGKSVKHPCPVCNGSKEVDAVINIRWRASNDTDRR